jgi:TRAP-type C4-dicarboxylate transport system permease small subunit
VVGERVPLDRLFDVIDRVARRLTQALLLGIVGIVSAQAFCRFVLNASLVWSEEVSAWCMVWVVFLGAVSLMRRDGPVSIPIFVTLLPSTARAAAVLVSRAAGLAACVFLAWYGVGVVAGNFNMLSQATGVDTRWVKLCVPVSAALMALFAAASLAGDIARLCRSGRDAVAVPGARRAETLREAGAEL